MLGRSSLLRAGCAFSIAHPQNNLLKRGVKSVAHKGKRLHPDYNRVHAFYFQLSKDMQISEKRRCVLCEFPNSANPTHGTLYKWIRQWESNRETVR